MLTTDYRQLAIDLQVGGVVHVTVCHRGYLIEDDGGHSQMSARHRLQGHQCLVDRTDTVIDHDYHRELQRFGEVGVQSVFRQRRVKSAGAFDDQAAIGPVAGAGVDQVLQLHRPSLQARRSMRRQRSAKPIRRDLLDRFARAVRLPQRGCVVGQQIIAGTLPAARFGGFAGFDDNTCGAQLTDNLAGDIRLADIGIGAGDKITSGIGFQHPRILCKLDGNCKPRLERRGFTAAAAGKPMMKHAGNGAPACYNRA